jgi:hypothetical protein
LERSLDGATPGLVRNDQWLVDAHDVNVGVFANLIDRSQSLLE